MSEGGIFLNKKWIIALLALALCLPLIGGSAASDEYPKTITDSAGREVTIQMPIERIIVLHSDAAEAVRLLGAGDKIVGVTTTITNFEDYFPELQDREVVGTWREFDFEKIAEIAREGGDTIVPDIVVIGYPSGSYKGESYAVDAVEAGLAPFESITVVGFDLNKPETMETELTTLGELLGKEEEAQDFLDWYYEKVEDVENKVEGLSAPTIYIELNSKQGLGSLQTAGTAYSLQQMLDIAAGENIVKEEASEIYVTWEWVVNENPEVIVLRPSTIDPSITGLGWNLENHGTLIEQLRSELMNRDGAQFVSAVKDDKVYVIYRDIFFGPDQVAGLTYLAKILHPEAELDPDEVYRQYFERIGMEYPEGNVFVYPSPATG